MITAPTGNLDRISEMVEEVRRRRRLPSPARARLIRERAGLSRKRLALAIGVHPMTLTRWERAERRPTGSKGIRYYVVLDELRRV